MFKKIIQPTVIGLCCAAIILWVIPYFTNNKAEFAFLSTKGKASILTFAPAVQIASPAVVNVYNQSFTQIDDSSSKTSEQLRVHSLGSGVIMRSNGYILTNRHVIEGADQIIVALQNGQIFQAQLIGSDQLTDLAVLKIDTNNLPTIPQNSKRAVEVGDVVLAIGNPYNLGQSVSQGIISATGRNTLGEFGRQNFLQTDASINRGNSGGALINSAGELIGINTLSLGKDNSKDGIAEGLNFAIPISIADHVLDQIIKNGRVIRGYFGVQSKVFYNNENGLKIKNEGVLVTGLAPNGPAAKAGLEIGDMIVAINKKAVRSPTKLLESIANTAPGTELNVSILRTNKSLNIPVIVGEYPNLQ